jgi:hypothetical protein
MDLNELYLFKAGSANDYDNKHLWIKGASLFIPQLNKLLKYSNYIFNIIDIHDYENNTDELAELFNKYGSDKATKHNYYIMYSFVLNKLGRNSKFPLCFAVRVSPLSEEDDLEVESTGEKKAETLPPYS